MTAHPEGGFDILGLPAEWDGREPFIGASGMTADRVLPCGKLGCFADFTGTCIYCGRAVVTLPVSLAAAAEDLRLITYGCKGHYANEIRAVADLIDGTLAEHELRFDHTDHQVYCTRCDLDPGPCPTLQLLVPVVRAFLPDWNPTEETP